MTLRFDVVNSEKDPAKTAAKNVVGGSGYPMGGGGKGSLDPISFRRVSCTNCQACLFFLVPRASNPIFILGACFLRHSVSCMGERWPR